MSGSGVDGSGGLRRGRRVPGRVCPFGPSSPLLAKASRIHKGHFVEVRRRWFCGLPVDLSLRGPTRPRERSPTTHTRSQTPQVQNPETRSGRGRSLPGTFTDRRTGPLVALVWLPTSLPPNSHGPRAHTGSSTSPTTGEVSSLSAVRTSVGPAAWGAPRQAHSTHPDPETTKTNDVRD